jgi:hypothetical protein
MEPTHKKRPSIKLTVRPSTVEDCEPVFNNLREDDSNEVQAVLGQSELAALVFAWEQTPKPFAIVSDRGTAEAIFGVVPVEPGVGAVWLLGTDALVEARFQFLRESRKWVEEVAQGYNLLFNYIDERNSVHQDWLRWTGFTFIARHEKYGVEERPFLEFVRIF